MFQGVRRQRGHGAITKFAVPLISSGIKKATPFLKSVAKRTVKKFLPNNPFARYIANKAVDKVTQKLSSKPLIAKAVGSVERKGQRLFKRKKRTKRTIPNLNQTGKNIFY